MKTITTITLILVTMCMAQARNIKPWSYQEMYDKADLVVIAQPISTQDTTERTTLPAFSPKVQFIGLSTELAISVVMKGDKSISKVTLHHYRLVDPGDGVANGPELAQLDPKQYNRYLLFLHREADGRYSPVSGQTDPAIDSVLKLDGLAE